jgi:DNA-binding transcriptional MerR regulator
MRESNLSCDEKWVNSETVMRKLGISKRTLQNYRDYGVLPHSIVGGKFFYSIRDIDDLMAKNYAAAWKK